MSVVVVGVVVVIEVVVVATVVALVAAVVVAVVGLVVVNSSDGNGKYLIADAHFDMWRRLH